MVWVGGVWGRVKCCLVLRWVFCFLGEWLKRVLGIIVCRGLRVGFGIGLFLDRDLVVMDGLRIKVGWEVVVDFGGYGV